MWCAATPRTEGNARRTSEHADVPVVVPGDEALVPPRAEQGAPVQPVRRPARFKEMGEGDGRPRPGPNVPWRDSRILQIVDSVMLQESHNPEISDNDDFYSKFPKKTTKNVFSFCCSVVGGGKGQALRNTLMGTRNIRQLFQVGQRSPQGFSLPTAFGSGRTGGRKLRMRLRLRGFGKTEYNIESKNPKHIKL